MIDNQYVGTVKIRRDSSHRIGTDLFGRAYLSVSFGTRKSEVLKPGLVPHMGKKPTDLGKIMDTAGGVMEEAEGLPTEVKKLTVSLNENQEKVLNEFLGILQENRENIKIFMARIADVANALSTGKGTFGKLIKEDGIYKKADKAMDQVNVIGSRFSKTGKIINEILGENRRNIKKVTDNLADASPDLTHTLKTIREMLDENRANLKRIIEDVSEATPKVNKSLYDINIMTGKMVKGEGAVGKLIMSDDFEKTFTKTVNKLGEASKEITQFAEGANRLKTYLGIDMRSNTFEQETMANVYLRIIPSANKEYYLAGTFYINFDEPDPLLYPDIDQRESTFSGMTFNLLLGWRFWDERITFKIGALESMVGGVFEYSFFYNTRDIPNLKEDRWEPQQITSIVLEARALDDDFEKDKYEKWETDIMVRMMVRHKFGNGIVFQVGGENLLNTPRFLVGFAFEYLDDDIKYVAGTVQ
jgi:hypothetical protein